jgi:hypothetical protein
VASLDEAMVSIVVVASVVGVNTGVLDASVAVDSVDVEVSRTWVCLASEMQT